MGKLRKPDAGAILGRRDPVMADKDFEDLYPTLHAYLTCEKFDDGSLRTTATLLMFVDSGALKLCLNDRFMNRSCFVTAVTVADALANLEAGLADDTVEWKVKGSKPGTPGWTPF